MFRPVTPGASTSVPGTPSWGRFARGAFDAAAPALAPGGALAAIPVHALLQRVLRADSLPTKIMGRGGLNAELFEGLTDGAFVATGQLRAAAIAQRDAVRRVVRESLDRLASELGPRPLDGLPVHHATRFAELLRDGLRRSSELRAIAGQSVSGPGPRHDLVIDKAMEQVRRVIAEAMRPDR